MRADGIVMAAIAVSVGCGPEPSPTFEGDYTAEGNSTCRIHHPAAPTFINSSRDDVSIVEDDEGNVLLRGLSMPPCSLEGMIEGDELRLSAEGCEVPQTYSGDEYAISYYEIEGEARWQGDALVVHIETGRRYTEVLGQLSEWWDDPGSCSARYSLMHAES